MNVAGRTTRRGPERGEVRGPIPGLAILRFRLNLLFDQSMVSFKVRRRKCNDYSRGAAAGVNRGIHSKRFPGTAAL